MIDGSLFTNFLLVYVCATSYIFGFRNFTLDFVIMFRRPRQRVFHFSYTQKFILIKFGFFMKVFFPKHEGNNHDIFLRNTYIYPTAFWLNLIKKKLNYIASFYWNNGEWIWIFVGLNSHLRSSLRNFKPRQDEMGTKYALLGNNWTGFVNWKYLHFD